MKTWLVFSLLAILVWGVWGFLTKWSVDRLGSLPAYLTFALGGVLIPLCLLPATKLPTISGPFWIALAAGLLGGVGTLLIARALATGKANAVVPITAQYVLVTVILTTLFYNEPISIKRIVGVVLSVAAIILLSLD